MPEATRQYQRDLEAVRAANSHDASTETRLDLERQLAVSEANLIATWAGFHGQHLDALTRLLTPQGPAFPSDATRRADEPRAPSVPRDRLPGA
jgi:hypothetical protein